VPALHEFEGVVVGGPVGTLHVGTGVVVDTDVLLLPVVVTVELLPSVLVTVVDTDAPLVLVVPVVDTDVLLLPMVVTVELLGVLVSAEVVDVLLGVLPVVVIVDVLLLLLLLVLVVGLLYKLAIRPLISCSLFCSSPYLLCSNRRSGR
jgi:hypothetical protein